MDQISKEFEVNKLIIYVIQLVFHLFVKHLLSSHHVPGTIVKYGVCVSMSVCMWI